MNFVMVDYFVINPTSFYSRKRIIVNEKLQAKINDIIVKHSCFMEESIHMAPTMMTAPQKPQHFHRKHQNNNHRGNGNHHHQPKQMPYSMRSVPRPAKLLNLVSCIDASQREINGYLNKISPKNYMVIQRKLLQFCKQHPTTISTIVQLLLGKCVSQQCFAGLYMSLIIKLDEIAQTDTRITTNTFVDEWVATISDKLTQLEASYVLYNASYDDMCKCFKLKGNIISQNRCILELIKHRFIDMDYAKYWQIVWGVLVHHKDAIQSVDTLTQCLMDQFEVAGMKYLVDEDFINVSSFYRDVVMERCGMNTQFKWHDLMCSLGIAKN